MTDLRILVDIDLPDESLHFYDGQGSVFVADDGTIYRSAQFTADALQSIQNAINGEAVTIGLSMVSVPTGAADAIWEYDESTSVVGSPITISVQELDEYGQPSGFPDVQFTGTIENMDVDDHGVQDDAGDYKSSVINLEIANKFTLRRLTNGSVLSDVDQRARSQILNPSAYPLNPDQYCVRVSILLNHTVAWPNW